MPNLLYKCMTKATIAEGDQVRHSLNWAVSRRGILKIYDDHIECGDWKILNEEIAEAVLTSFRSSLFIPGYILRIETAGQSYQFGVNGGKYWKSQLPFPVTREKGRLGYSIFSVLARGCVFGAVAYWLWTKFFETG